MRDMSTWTIAIPHLIMESKQVCLIGKAALIICLLGQQIKYVITRTNSFYISVIEQFNF